MTWKFVDAFCSEFPYSFEQLYPIVQSWSKLFSSLIFHTRFALGKFLLTFLNCVRLFLTWNIDSRNLSSYLAIIWLKFLVSVGKTMGKPTPIFAREMGVRLQKQKFSQVEISKITGIPRSTVRDIISKSKRDGHVTPSVSSGRPPKVSIHSKRLQGRLSKACPFLTSKRLKNEWRQCYKVSTRTVRRFHKNGS